MKIFRFNKTLENKQGNCEGENGRGRIKADAGFSIMLYWDEDDIEFSSCLVICARVCASVSLLIFFAMPFMHYPFRIYEGKTTVMIINMALYICFDMLILYSRGKSPNGWMDR